MSVKKIPEHYRYLGRLGKTYQLKGGLRLYSDMSDEVLFRLERIFIENVGESDVREIKEVGKEIIIYLTHALSVEQAQRLVNKNLYVHSEFLSKEVAPDVIGLPGF